MVKQFLDTKVWSLEGHSIVVICRANEIEIPEFPACLPAPTLMHQSIVSSQ